jgi:hypothetical protein
MDGLPALVQAQTAVAGVCRRLDLALYFTRLLPWFCVPFAATAIPYSLASVPSRIVSHPVLPACSSAPSYLPSVWFCCDGKADHSFGACRSATGSLLLLSSFFATTTATAPTSSHPPYSPPSRPLSTSQLRPRPRPRPLQLVARRVEWPRRSCVLEGSPLAPSSGRTMTSKRVCAWTGSGQSAK